MVVDLANMHNQKYEESYSQVWFGIGAEEGFQN
jgi:hypothetical protein